jgi:nitrate/nitrite transport system substrate-binding protein
MAIERPLSQSRMKFAIPFDYSMHTCLLRYYLAGHGVDPDTDVQLRSVPPPEMVANLRADNIDGFLAPDNICQRAIYDGVGFLHILSKEIWDGHPCCSFAASREFITTSPNSFAALTRAIIDATAYASKPENRKQIAEAIAPANYINMRTDLGASRPTPSASTSILFPGSRLRSGCSRR